MSSQTWNPMNADAKRFFEENPGERYWYYSPGLRVPSPQIYRSPGYQPDPWPGTPTEKP